MRSLVCVFLLFFSYQALATSPESQPALDEVVITGTFRPAAAVDVPASVSVLDATTLREAGQEHLEDVLALIIGQRSASTDRKVSLNAALRDFGVPA